MTNKNPIRKVALEHGLLPSSRVHSLGSQWLAAFLNGLLRPSAIAVSVAVLIIVAGLVAPMILVTPKFVANHGKELLADRTDYDMSATAELFDLERRPAEQPFVAILGGSTIRAAILKEDIADGLLTRDISDYEVFKLCTSRQSLWESLAFAESLPEHSKGYVLIGVGPSLFTMDPEETLVTLSENPRLGFRSESLDDAFRSHDLRVQRTTGNYFIDNSAFWLARTTPLWRYALTGRRAAYDIESNYARREPVSLKTWQSHCALVDARFAVIEENWPSNLALLDRVIETIQSRTEVEVILVETPINPRFVTEFHREQLLDWHKSRLRAFASERSLPYVSLNDEADLDASVFFDWAHVNDRNAAKRCAEAVLRHIQPVEVLPTNTME